MNVVEAFLVLVRLAIGCWLLWSVPRLHGCRAGNGPAIDPTDLGRVSVVIPARDEEGSLPRLLRSLADGPEVIVVDDHSSDGTPLLAALDGARVIPSEPLPEGWTGKSWACEQGAAAAVGDTLVFVDADVRFADGGLDSVAAMVHGTGGLVSVQPFHCPERPAEHLGAIFNIVAFAGTDAATPLGRTRGVRGAFGPVLATSRSDYEAVGRHASVRASLVDDVDLAARYRMRSLPVTILGGGDAASFRMYPQGLGQLVEGFTKNLAAGVRRVRPATTVLVLAWLTVLVQASVAPARTLIAGDEAGLAVAIGLYAVVALQFWWMARRLGRFGGWVAATFPLSVALFFGVFAGSVVSTVRGSVSWRGRRVSTRRGPHR